MGLDVYLNKVITKEEFIEEFFHYCEKILSECSEEQQTNIIAMFPDKVYEKAIEYIDFHKIFKRKKLDFNDYHQVSQCGNQFKFVKNIDYDLYHFTDTENWNKYELTINVRTNSPMYSVNEKVIYLKEVYDQRKGANSQFYEDGQWETGGYLTTKKEVEEHYYKYFAPEWTRDYKVLPAKDYFDEFYERILTQFVEGEMILCYW